MKYESAKRVGGYALERLFHDCSVSLVTGRTGFQEANGLPPHWPTFPDAEVQVMDPIGPDHLLGAWVETAEDAAFVQSAFDAARRADCEVLEQSFAPRISGMGYSWG